MPESEKAKFYVYDIADGEMLDDDGHATLEDARAAVEAAVYPEDFIILKSVGRFASTRTTEFVPDAD